MDGSTLRARLASHGKVTGHRDGHWTLRLVRPAEENFDTQSLWRVVHREIPGAVLNLWRCRRAADRYFEVHEVLFRLGPAPESRMVESAA